MSYSPTDARSSPVKLFQFGKRVALISAIQEHPSLTHLDIGYSHSTRVLGAVSNLIGDVGAVAIANLLSENQTLLLIAI